jgi:hypothetical protein
MSEARRRREVRKRSRVMSHRGLRVSFIGILSGGLVGPVF